jgi:hypothetical protein
MGIAPNNASNRGTRMMIYTEAAIISLYEESLAKAEDVLSALEVAECRRPSARGLNGWVFEQTIRFCLSRELGHCGLHVPIQEQVPLLARARIDLLVGRTRRMAAVRGYRNRTSLVGWPHASRGGEYDRYCYRGNC